MWLYLLIFFIPFVVYYSDSKQISKNSTFLFVYLFFLAAFVGLSDMFGGYDRYIYGEVFDSVADITTARESYLQHGAFLLFKGEPGYIILNILISFITENRYVFILIYTCVVYFLLYQTLKEYAQNYPLALILFMGLWFFFTFTYLRQVLGATIVWLGIKYVINRNFWKFLFIFLIAWSMHKSAIIFFPVYFIPIKKYSVGTIVTVMIIALLIGISPLPNKIFNLYGDNSIIEQRADYSSSGGVRIAYFLEAVFFLFIIIFNYFSIGKNKVDILMLNIALLFCMTLLLFIRSENGGRLSWYFMIGIIITLSNFCKNIKRKTTLSVGLVVLSLVLYIRVYNSWQAYYFLYPYKTFLTNGYRSEDIIHGNYEYNNMYDTDKFHRKPFRMLINVKL